MLRTVRLIHAGVLSAVALWLVGCAESGPTAPKGLFRTDMITCQASVTAATLTCASSQAQPNPKPASGMNFNLVLGGQGALVRLASSGTAYSGGIFSSNVTVENLIAQSMNTANNTTADAGGIKVFLNADPSVTGGTGVVTVKNADGTGTFTQANQSFFLYSDGVILPSGSTTASKSWQFNVPGTVTRFEFVVFVTTRLPDEVNPIVALGLSRSPGVLAIAQGGSAPTTVVLTRTNFTGAVTLSLVSPPSGVTGGFSPAAPTGTTSTLTVSVGAAVPVGTYTLTISGTSGAGTRFTTLTLVVGTAGSGNVTVDFSGCAVGQRADWLAAKDGNGAWTQITGTGDVYHFTIASGKGGVAYLVLGANASDLTVQYMTQAEFTAGTFVPCPPPASGKTINGSVKGTSGVDITSISLGGQNASASFGTMPFTLNDVPDGNQDLVAYSQDLLGGGDHAIIRRSQNFADNSTIPVLDFSTGEAFTPASATITLVGLTGTEAEVTQHMSYQVNANCAPAFLYSGGASASFTAFGIPAPQQLVTDFHALEVLATASTGFRTLTQYNHDFMARTLTLGAVLPAPTITDLGGLYKRLQAAYTLPTDYEGFTSFGYNDGANKQVTITATFGYLGGTGVTLALDDFSAVGGWNNSFAPAPGGTANWSLTGTSPFASACTEGATFKNAQETGTF